MKNFLKKMILPTIIMGWATVFLLEVLQYPPKNYIIIRPVYFVMLAFFLVNAVLDFMSCRKDEKEHSNSNVDASIPTKDRIVAFVKSDRIKVPSIFVIFLLAAVLLNILGFFIVLPVFIFSILRIAGVTSWKTLVILSVIVTVVLYLIFQVGLNVTLPYGFFA